MGKGNAIQELAVVIRKETRGTARSEVSQQATDIGTVVEKTGGDELLIELQDTGLILDDGDLMWLEHRGGHPLEKDDDVLLANVKGDYIVLGRLGDVETAQFGYAETVGDGAETIFVIEHDLGTRDVICRARKTDAPFNDIEMSYDRPTVDTVRVDTGAYVPSQDGLRIMIVKAM